MLFAQRWKTVKSLNPINNLGATSLNSSKALEFINISLAPLPPRRHQITLAGERNAFKKSAVLYSTVFERLNGWALIIPSDTVGANFSSDKSYTALAVAVEDGAELGEISAIWSPSFGCSQHLSAAAGSTVKCVKQIKSKVLKNFIVIPNVNWIVT